MCNHRCCFKSGSGILESWVKPTENNSIRRHIDRVPHYKSQCTSACPGYRESLEQVPPEDDDWLFCGPILYSHYKDTSASVESIPEEFCVKKKKKESSVVTRPG